MQSGTLCCVVGFDLTWQPATTPLAALLMQTSTVAFIPLLMVREGSLDAEPDPSPSTQHTGTAMREYAGGRAQAACGAQGNMQ